MSTTSAAVLSVKQLCKAFGPSTVVDRLDLEVGRGEILALLGPNGAGKTTTINLLLGFLKPDGGSAYIAGIDVASDIAAVRRVTAYIPEQVNLYPSLSGRENLEYFCALAGLRPGRTALGEFLTRAGLQKEALDRRVGEYSKGMRQKVGIAIALSKNASALLLDEPTSGLDPSAAREFNALIRQTAERGMAVLMATHDLFRAKEVAHRVGIMRRGRLVAVRSAADVAHVDLEALYLELMAEEA